MADNIWIKINKNVNADGTTITYQHKDNPWLVIQSRKRHIPHANRSGTWDHTTYWVLINGVEEREFYSLRDAKEYCAELYGLEAST